MASATPRSNARMPHTPKVSERKRGLFQVKISPKQLSENVSKHRLAVLDSESDTDSCDLGIISTLDSSSSDDAVDHSFMKSENSWRETRKSQRTQKSQANISDFLKSPLSFKNYFGHHSQPSPPATPGRCSRSSLRSARRNMGTFIADTESCSSSLKDLNFDSDSSADMKENTPKKTPKPKNSKDPHLQYENFKGVLAEQKPNLESRYSPIKTRSVTKNCQVVMQKETISLVSPTSMLKTPHNMSDTQVSPPKLSHNRRSVIAADKESPISPLNVENPLKRHRVSTTQESEHSPNKKSLKLDPSVASNPKARLSLFNSERLKESLSVKSFYPKQETDLNLSFTSHVMGIVKSKGQRHQRRTFSHSMLSRKKRRKMGQINMGVGHRIRKPKIVKYNNVTIRSNKNLVMPRRIPQNETSQNSSRLDNSDFLLEKDKQNPFASEQQTVNTLLCQWTEEEVPSSEPQISTSNSNSDINIRQAESLLCFNQSAIEETSSFFNTVTAVPVAADSMLVTAQPEKVIMNIDDGCIETENAVQLNMTSGLETVNNEENSSCVLTIDGYVMTGNSVEVSGLSETPTDLDAIEDELRNLDDQILKMAQQNNINPQLLLATSAELNADLTLAGPVFAMDELSSSSTANSEHSTTSSVSSDPAHALDKASKAKPDKLFPVFTPAALSHAGVPKVRSHHTVKPNKKATVRSNLNQYVIDAGQKKIGATQCAECGVIYEIGDPQDENDHLMYHNAVDVLKFNGWKEESVVGVWEASRCVCVRPGAPESHWRKVHTLLARVVHPQLGYSNPLKESHDMGYTAYLYVEKRQIIGCLIAERRKRANRLLPGEVDCCSEEEYPVKCGISRLWTHISHRRRSIATRLLNSMRATFCFGHILDLQDIAFSSPTPTGKVFAQHYTSNKNFLVYLE